MANASFPRFAQGYIEVGLSDTPVVVIQGARQVGKSTLAQRISEQYAARVITLDDPLTLSVAKEDPVQVIDQFPEGLLVIDEAQRAPEIVLPIKASVDQTRKPGRFLLTGSADLLTVRGVADSLAGRIEIVEMLPLSQGELNTREDQEDFTSWLLQNEGNPAFNRLDPASVIAGGFPEAVKRTPQRARTWFTSYVQSLAEHDARELHRGAYSDHLQQLLTVLAASGQAELVKAKLARELGVAESSVDIYLRLARAMRLIVEFPAWNRTPRNRIVRRPKVCLVDTGLSAALAKFSVAQVLSPGGTEFYGSLVEQFVALELVKQRTWSSTPFNIYHFRDHDGLEVDLLLETDDGKLIAIEVKSSQTVTSSSWKNLLEFRERFQERDVVGVVLHSGDQTAKVRSWLSVLPITALWQH